MTGIEDIKERKVEYFRYKCRSQVVQRLSPNDSSLSKVSNDIQGGWAGTVE